MTSHIPVVFWFACATMLILAFLCSGCTLSQKPQVTLAAISSPPGGSNIITINDFAFNPVNLSIETGTTVTWLNQDAAVHQIDSDKKTPVAFMSDSLGNGESFSFTFNLPGIYSYHCLYHPQEKGTIIVQS